MTGGGIWPSGQDAESAAGDQSKTTVDGPILEGAYRIFRIVGEGGMGTVYEGQQLRQLRLPAQVNSGYAFDFTASGNGPGNYTYWQYLGGTSRACP